MEANLPEVPKEVPARVVTEPAAPQAPAATPVPPAQTLPVAKTYVCMMVPDGGDGPPEVFEAGSLEALAQTMYQTMIKMGKGWCVPIINGERAVISTPKQVFFLKLASGEKIQITDPESVSFEANGRFSTLSVKAP